jgi:hypothetical protein
VCGCEEEFAKSDYVKEGDRLWRAMLHKKYPATRSDKERGKMAANYTDPVEEMAKKVRAEPGGCHRPWTIMDSYESKGVPKATANAG